MPEEINRLLTDSISDLLFVTESSGVDNLKHEGIDQGKVELVGNVMIDSLFRMLEAAKDRETTSRLGLDQGQYGLVTLHRPSNVDDPRILGPLIELLHELSDSLPLVFPVHPRTAAAAERAGLADKLKGGESRLLCLEPQPYLDHLSLMSTAAVVLTDSGGMQEETSVLGIPCLTMRDNTERPITLELGTSRLVGNDSNAIRDAFAEAISGDWPEGKKIPLWDGRAGARIAESLGRRL
jgi:UDP-N-acetylglucosamine 2-epimerase (non-hydrolysing)